MRFSLACILLVKHSLADETKERPGARTNRAVYNHNNPDKSVSSFAQDEHNVVGGSKDSPSTFKGISKKSSVSSYNDRFDVGILGKVRSRNARRSTSQYDTDVARIGNKERLLASLNGDIPTSNVGSSSMGLYQLDSSPEELSHMSRKSSKTQKETSVKSTKSAKTTKASKSSNNDAPLTTTAITTYTLTIPKPAVEDPITTSGRNLQDFAGLSQPVLDAYELAFLTALQQSDPTVTDVTITSVTDDGLGNLAFVFNVTSVVDCPAPCNPAQAAAAEADSAATLEGVLADSVSDGSFTAALSQSFTTLNVTDTDCGPAFSCAGLVSSSANATVAVDVTGLGACPSTKEIVCDNGYATSVGGVPTNTSITCKAACDGNCCVGGNFTGYLPGVGTVTNYYQEACTNLTASICMDGKTCMDERACKDANVGKIFLGCNGGSTCSYAGKGGSIGSITKSCFELRACDTAAEYGYIIQIEDSCFGDAVCAFAAQDGYIGRILGSCNGNGTEDACYAAGYQGNISQIVDSCNARKACYYAAVGTEDAVADGLVDTGGYIREIVRSCNSDYSCDAAAFKGKIVSGIVDSCNAYKACYYSASEGGEIYSIENACNYNSACLKAAVDNGTIAQIQNSCFGKSACAFTGQDGVVGNIVRSCNGFKDACYATGYQGNIPFGIVDSCSAYKACNYAAAGTESALTDGLVDTGGYIREIVRSCNEEKSCYAAAYSGGNIASGITDSCNATEACGYVGGNGGEIYTIEDACNSEYACYQAAEGIGNNISSGIIGCCNNGNATGPSEGICSYANSDASLFSKDMTCPVSTPISDTAVAETIEETDEVALGHFLTDLAHELYKLVMELAKNKKD